MISESRLTFALGAEFLYILDCLASMETQTSTGVVHRTVLAS